MNRTCFLFSAMLLGAAGLPAQQLGGGVQATGPAQPAGVFTFQPAQSLAIGRGARAAMPLLRPEKGKPFSAKVTTQTIQTLSDGTHVSRTTTTNEYRDAEGRTRTETIPPANNSSVNILIRDPVAGATYRLNPAAKSVVKNELTVLEATATGRGGRSGRAASTQPPSTTPEEAVARLKAIVDGHQVANAVDEVNRLAEVIKESARRDPNVNVEDLGMATVNGVQARGTRTTTVVPAGAIGNDREFRSIDERWFSSDLNLLIKSENTDPRFGKTTYELTNISRQPPDPALFQVPSDYTVVSSGGRGKQ